MNPKIEFRLAQLEEILPLRHEVLIINTNRTSDIFDGDYDKSTYHFGAFLGDETLCCLSWMASEYEGQPAYQLRGMATQPKWRGYNIGARLLEFSERFLYEKGVRLAWCNARPVALGFYLKMGWTTVSDEFIIEGVGPHIRMTKTLEGEIS